MENITNIQELKQYIKNGEVTISLLNDTKTEYSIDKFNLLKEILENKDSLTEIQNLNIVVLNERIPYNEFSLIKDFYNNTKGAFNLNLSVTHKLLGYNEETVEKLWDIDTIIKANNYINDICSYIKKQNMSPAEIVAYVHLVTSSICSYVVSNKPSWYSNDQFFTGAFMKNPEFVCAGCTSLFKEIIDNLDMPEIKCDVILLNVYDLDKHSQERHCRLKLNVVDKKYSINDEFYDDPTWDLYQFDNCYKYSNMFMPSDIHEDNKTKYSFDDFSVKTQNSKSELKIKYFYPDSEWKTEEILPLQQSTVEKIVFTALSNIKNKNFEETYLEMQQMAKVSFMDQTSRRYKSTLSSPNLLLNKQQAEKIYNEANKKEEELLF